MNYRTEGNLDHVLSLSKGPVGQDRAGNAKGRITVNLTAMGMSLNFLDLVRNESDTPATSEKGDAAASLAVSTTEQASYMCAPTSASSIKCCLVSSFGVSYALPALARLTTNLDIAMTYSLDASGAVWPCTLNVRGDRSLSLDCTFCTTFIRPHPSVQSRCYPGTTRLHI